jgi:hypothetical protein
VVAIWALFPPSVLGVAVPGGVSGHLAKGMPRSEAKLLGDFIGPDQAGLVTVGESKVEDAIQHDVIRAGKQTAKELDVHVGAPSTLQSPLPRSSFRWMSEPEKEIPLPLAAGRSQLGLPGIRCSASPLAGGHGQPRSCQ